MIRLTREVRFTLLVDDSQPPKPPTNSWAGIPVSDHLSPYMILRCTIGGHVQADTGYVLNIKEIDRALREEAVESLLRESRQTPGGLSGSDAIHIAWNALTDQFDSVAMLERLELKTTPFLRYIRYRESMTTHVTQQFEFSAAHRLHCDRLSDDENRQLFGKCNHPNGHGHNYRVDVTISGDPDQAIGRLIPMDQFESIVQSTIIQPFDHRNLNIDIDEFQTLNPTVENVAVVIWNRLDSKLAPSRLECVRVFETPKTWAEYFGPNHT